MALLLLGCIPEIVTVTPHGDGSYGVGPSMDCLVCSFVSFVLVFGLGGVISGLRN